MPEKMTENVTRSATLKMPIPNGRETVWIGAEVGDSAHPDESTEAHRLRINVETLDQLIQLKKATEKFLGAN